MFVYMRESDNINQLQRMVNNTMPREKERASEREGERDYSFFFHQGLCGFSLSGHSDPKADFCVQLDLLMLPYRHLQTFSPQGFFSSDTPDLWCVLSGNNN